MAALFNIGKKYPHNYMLKCFSLTVDIRYAFTDDTKIYSYDFHHAKDAYSVLMFILALWRKPCLSVQS
jgi:hypothetical protein